MKKIVQKEYKTFLLHGLDSSFDVLVSIGGDGTILRAATLVRDSEFYIRYKCGKTRFLATVQKEDIDSFFTNSDR
jgi:NAD+ kinase